MQSDTDYPRAHTKRDMAKKKQKNESAAKQITFENTKAPSQGLTFSALERKGVALKKDRLKSLRFLDADGDFTSLALLYSDQCPPLARVLVFADPDGLQLRSEETASGNLIDQCEELVEKVCSQAPAWPRQAIREALGNSLVHRSYELESPVVISLYPDQITLLSPGGLLVEVTKDDILHGISLARNKRLFATSVQLGFAHGVGLGLRTILSCYKDSTRKPTISLTTNSFTLTLPRPDNGASEDTGLSLTPRQEKIMDGLRQKGSLSREELEALLGVSKPTAVLDLRPLLARGLVTKAGGGKLTRYQLAQ